MRQIHPLADAIPRMSSEKYEELKQDIKERGLLHPIVLFEDLILDGYHRHEACIELGVAPFTKIYDGDDPVAFVRSHNLYRRHLDAGQRAVAEVQLTAAEEKWLAIQRQQLGLKRGNKSPSVSRDTDGGRTRQKIAKRANVGEATAAKALRVADEAPDLAEEVKAGTKSLNAAYKETKERKTDSSKEFDDYLVNRLDPEEAAAVLTPDSRRPYGKQTANQWADSMVEAANHSVKALIEKLPLVVMQAVAQNGDKSRWAKTLRSTSEALNKYLQTLEG